MAYKVKLPVFEGPFDLLFHLLKKNEIDIYDIPISQITEQYLNHLDQMKLLDLEVTSEFLVFATKLLSIKAKMLLPKAHPKKEDECQEEADPRDELVLRLLEYKRFKEVTEILKNMEQSQVRVYSRPNIEDMFLDYFKEENPVEGIKSEDLILAIKDILNKAVEKEMPPEIPKEEFSLRDKMSLILKRLIFYPDGLTFKDMFTGQINRVEIVVTFLAVLELIKLKKINIQQSTMFGEIMIYNRLEGNLSLEGASNGYGGNV